MCTLTRCIVLAFFVVSVVNPVTGTDTEKNKGKSPCIFHINAMKDAKYEVTNTPDGVTMKITSYKPEVVKKIQETVEKCHEAHKSGDHKHMCPMKKASESPGHKEHEGKK